MCEEDLKGIRSDIISLISKNSMDYDHDNIVSPDHRQHLDLESDNIIAPDNFQRSILVDLGLHNQSSASLLSSFSCMSVNSRRFSSFLSSSMKSSFSAGMKSASRRVSDMSYQFCDEVDEDISDERFI